MKEAQIFGLNATHLVQWRGHWVHPFIVDDLSHLCANANKAGFDLGVVSAFRSYGRQQKIWNDKASGRRPVLDEYERPIDIGHLAAGQLVEKIMRWSALPGASRHHWGTDFDVYDAGVVATGHKLQLTVGETLDDGPFGAFYSWLDGYLSENVWRFFRPYQEDRGGVAVEPWHLSHTRTAAAIQSHYDKAQLRSLVADNDIELKAAVLEHFDALFSRFIWVPWSTYPNLDKPDGGRAH